MGDLLKDLWQDLPIQRKGRLRKSATDADSVILQNLLWFKTPEHEQVQPTPRKKIERRTPQQAQLSEAEQAEIEKLFGDQPIM